MRHEVTDEETPQEATPEEKPANGEEIDHGESMENIDLDAYFGAYWEGSGHSSMMEERDEPPIENSLSREPDLYDHLLWQLHMADVTPRQREIAELIIGNLNPDGFLVATPEEIRALGDRELVAPVTFLASCLLWMAPENNAWFGVERDFRFRRRPSVC